MKKIIFILALIFGTFLFNSSKSYISNNSFPKTRLDSLMSKKWRWDGEYFTKTQTYFKETIISKERLRNDNEYIIRYSYYLTDSISNLGMTVNSTGKNFDWDKIGKNHNGRYLVAILIEKKGQKIIGVCSIYEILEFTDTKLTLQDVFSTGEWCALQSKVYRAEPLD